MRANQTHHDRQPECSSADLKNVPDHKRESIWSSQYADQKGKKIHEFPERGKSFETLRTRIICIGEMCALFPIMVTLYSGGMAAGYR